MTTDKERATTLRQIADLYHSIGRDAMAMIERRTANELDPPAPTYADGTIAWVTNQHGRRYLCTWHAENREWCIGGPNGDSGPGKVTKVEPLRVLADDEIAVSPAVHPHPQTIQFLKDNFYFSTAELLQDVHDAIAARYAEAGDQS